MTLGLALPLHETALHPFDPLYRMYSRLDTWEMKSTTGESVNSMIVSVAGLAWVSGGSDNWGGL